MENKKQIEGAFITIKKGNQIMSILVKEDKRVYFNFGDNNWIKFEELEKLIFNKKYKKLMGDLADTKKVIEESKDYKELVKKFEEDFKKDHGNIVVVNKVLMEDGKI